MWRAQALLDINTTRLQLLMEVEQGRLTGKYLLPPSSTDDEATPGIVLEMQQSPAAADRPTYEQVLLAEVASDPAAMAAAGWLSFNGSSSRRSKRGRKSKLQLRPPPIPVPEEAENLNDFEGFWDELYTKLVQEQADVPAFHTAALATDFSSHDSEEEEVLLLMQEEAVAEDVIRANAISRVQQLVQENKAPEKGYFTLPPEEELQLQLLDDDAVKFKVFSAVGDSKKYIKRMEFFGLDVDIRYYGVEDGKEVDTLSVDEPQDDDESLQDECPFDFCLSRRLFVDACC